MGTRLGSHGSLWRPPGTAQSWYARSDRSHRCCSQCWILNQWDFHRFSRKNGWIPLNSTIIPASLEEWSCELQPIQVLFGMISAVSTSISHSGLGAHCYRNSTGPYRVLLIQQETNLQKWTVNYPSTSLCGGLPMGLPLYIQFSGFCKPKSIAFWCTVVNKINKTLSPIAPPKVSEIMWETRQMTGTYRNYVWDYRITNRIHFNPCDEVPATVGSLSPVCSFSTPRHFDNSVARVSVVSNMGIEHQACRIVDNGSRWKRGLDRQKMEDLRFWAKDRFWYGGTNEI